MGIVSAAPMVLMMMDMVAFVMATPPGISVYSNVFAT
jgi:hypothetical protein